MPIIGVIGALGYCVIKSIGIDLRHRRIMPWDVYAAVAVGWSRREIASPLSKEQFVAAGGFTWPRVAGAVAVHLALVAVALVIETVNAG